MESVDRVEADVVDSVADETISLAECSDSNSFFSGMPLREQGAREESKLS